VWLEPDTLQFTPIPRPLDWFVCSKLPVHYTLSPQSEIESRAPNGIANAWILCPHAVLPIHESLPYVLPSRCNAWFDRDIPMSAAQSLPFTFHLYILMPCRLYICLPRHLRPLGHWPIACLGRRWCIGLHPHPPATDFQVPTAFAELALTSAQWIRRQADTRAHGVRLGIRSAHRVHFRPSMFSA